MASPLRIVVVGSGPVGLAAAVIFAQQGYHLTVLERSDSLPHLGGAISFPANGVRVLARHGLFTQFRDQAVAAIVPQWPARDHTGKLLTDIDLRVDYSDQAIADALRNGEVPRVPHMAVTRGDFNRFLFDKLLSDHADSVEMIYGARVTSVDAASGHVHYTLDDSGDDQVVQGALILGADGINSVCHTAIASAADAQQEPEEKKEKKKTGNCTDSLIIPASVMSDPGLDELTKGATIWVGPKAHMVLLPLRGGAFGLNTSRPDDGSREQWDQEKNLDRLREFLKGWDPRLDKIVAGAEQAVKIGITYRGPVSQWSKGRLVLVGDAAHAMVPFTGQGLSQGLEDIDLLQLLLAKEGLSPTSSSSAADLFPILGKVYAMFAKMREPRTSLINETSLGNINVFESDEPEFVAFRNAKFAEEPNAQHMLMWKNPMVSSLVWGYDVSAFYQDFLDGKLPPLPPSGH